MRNGANTWRAAAAGRRGPPGSHGAARQALPLLAAALVLLAQLLIPASAYPFRHGDADQARGRQWVLGHAREDGCVGEGDACGHASTSWAILGLAAAGAAVRLLEPSPPSYLEGVAGAPGPLATDWERAIVAIAAAGEDPATFGGVDHWAALDGFFDGVQVGSPSAVNDDAWAVLAWSASERPEHRDRAAAVASTLRAEQRVDGGWPNWLATHPSGTWGTATASLALLATGEDPHGLAVARGLEWLDAAQLPSGLYPEDGATSAEATAWAILAVAAAGEDPESERWTPAGGPDAVTALRALQRTDGSFPHAPGGEGDLMATVQALLALSGPPFPFRPPEARIEWTPEAPRSGEPVELRDASMAGSAPLAERTWGGAAGGSAASLALDFAEPGPQRITLLVRDANGRAHATERLIEVGNRPPIPELRLLPPEPKVGEAFLLDASGSKDADGRVVSYGFLVDGEPLGTPGPNATRGFAVGNPGAHEARLVATDERGASAEAAVTFEVVAEEEFQPEGGAPAGDPPIPPGEGRPFLPSRRQGGGDAADGAPQDASLRRAPEAGLVSVALILAILAARRRLEKP